MTVLAAHNWPTNADLIADVAKLYLRKDMLMLDPTYGRGGWWKKWKPDQLTHSDLATDDIDFRALPHVDETFDAVAFDPPYVCVGGRTTTGISPMYERYGMAGTPNTPLGLQHLIEDGMDECRRVLKRKGLLLMKCADYVSSGKLWPGTFLVHEYADLTLGLDFVDRFEHVGRPRPQPKRDRQVHARRNLSTLFVFQKP